MTGRLPAHPWLALGLGCLVLGAGSLRADPGAEEPPAEDAPVDTPTEPETGPEPTPDPDPIGSWAFAHPDRPVKVVVLAGSIGAWPEDSYVHWIERWCGQIEVRNLSRQGYATSGLQRRFQRQVLANRRLEERAEDEERWVLFGGGLNSIGDAGADWPNRNIDRLFAELAAEDWRLVAFSLTPWGSSRDRRWRGESGARFHATMNGVVGHVLGHETPEVHVDLYHPGRLRDPKQEGVAAWFLRPELHAFDHVHPNPEGHRIIAETACPALPASWGCDCPEVKASEGGTPHW